MIDIDKLEALAKAASDGVVRSHGWDGTVEMGDHLGKDKDFMKAASPATILALIAEVRALRIDADRYRRLKTFAHPSYNVKVVSNAHITSLAKEEIMTVHAFSWAAMDAVLDGAVTVNTVNIKEQP